MVPLISIVLLLIGLLFIVIGFLSSRKSGTTRKELFHPIARIDSMTEGVTLQFEQCSSSSSQFPAFYFSEGICKSLDYVPNVTSSQLMSKFPNLFIRKDMAPKIRDSVFIDIVTLEETLNYTVQQSSENKPMFTRISIPSNCTVRIINEGNLKGHWSPTRKLGPTVFDIDSFKGKDAYICYL